MITVIQPDVTVGVGNFLHWLKEAGHEVRIVQTEKEPLPPVAEMGDGIVVLGGRMNIFATEEHPHLNDIRALIKDAIAADVPLFGICLGHQLLADTLGGTVVVGSDQEEDGPVTITLNHEGAHDPVLSPVSQAFGSSFPAAASHHDCVTEAPDGATVLASSDVCGIQALRYGSALSVQFHPEVTTESMCRWHSEDGGDYDAMAQMLAPHMEEISAVGKIMATSFAELAAKEN